MNLRDVRWEVLDCVQLAVVKTVMNLRDVRWDGLDCVHLAVVKTVMNRCLP
jgi:hypothetical protein